MRVKKDREAQLIHFSFFDILFGAFGAFVFLMLMQIIKTMQFVDIDIQKSFDEVVAEKNQLAAQVEHYKERENAYLELEKRYQEVSSKLSSVRKTNSQLQAKIRALEKEVASLTKLKEEYMRRGDIEKALRRENEELKRSLEEAYKKLSKLKTVPLRIKTTSLPTLITGERVNLALAAEGGVPPYKWEYKGKLPSGFYLDKENGLILGQTSKTGNYTLRIKVTDSTGNSVSSDKISFSVVHRPKEKKGISPWTLVWASISTLLLVYILYQKYKAWKYINEMKKRGYKLRFVYEGDMRGSTNEGND